MLHTQKKQVATQKKNQEMIAQAPAVKENGPKLITSKQMIMWEYPDVFQGIGKFPGPDIITSSLIQVYLPNKHLVDQSPYI